MDLTVLLAAYAAAVNGDGPRNACDLIHEQLMRERERQMSHRGGGRSHGGGYQSAHRSVDHHSHHGRSGGHHGRSPADERQSDRDSARLFVGGLPHDCVDEDLASLANQLQFSVHPSGCRLLECRVLPGRGCGYLRYASWEAAEEAFAALQGRQVEGWTQVLRVQWAAPKPGAGGDDRGERAAAEAERIAAQPPQAPLDPLCEASQEEVEASGAEPTRLFVGQIAREAHDAGGVLRPIFEHFGHLLEFRWVQEKGVLYAAYSSFAEAQLAMRKLGQRPVPGVSKALNIKFSQRRF